MFTQFRKIISLIFIPLIIFAIVYFESCGGSFTYTTLKNDCNTGRVIDSSANLVDTLYSGTNKNLNCINMLNPREGYISGDDGTILRTENGGGQWSAQISGTGVDLMGIFTISKDTAITVGKSGYVLRTSDKGITWDSINSTTSVDLNSVFFPKKDTGIICSNSGVILQTTNGGINWASIASGTVKNLYCVNFLGTGLGIIVGEDGVILRSTNGGSAWSVITTLGSDLNGVDFIDSKGFAVGDSGKIVITTDNGLNWNNFASPTTNNLKSVVWCMQKIAYAVGENGTDLFYDGTSWTARPAATVNDINFVHSPFYKIGSEILFPYSLKVGENGTLLQNNPTFCDGSAVHFFNPENCNFCILIERSTTCINDNYNQLIISSTSQFDYLSSCQSQMNSWTPAMTEDITPYYSLHNLSTNSETYLGLSNSNTSYNYRFYLSTVNGDASCYIELDSLICCNILN